MRKKAIITVTVIAAAAAVTAGLFYTSKPKAPVTDPDFSLKRLLVSMADGSAVDDTHVVSSYNGLYALSYDTADLAAELPPVLDPRPELIAPVLAVPPPPAKLELIALARPPVPIPPGAAATLAPLPLPLAPIALAAAGANAPAVAMVAAAAAAPATPAAAMPPIAPPPPEETPLIMPAISSGMVLVR